MSKDNNEDIEIEFPVDDEAVEDTAEETAETAEEAAEATEATETAETAEAVEEKDDKDAQIEELNKRYIALFAEYENFRKRSAKEKDQIYSDAVADVSGKWLDVLDNIERAIDSAEKADDTTADKVVEGVKMIDKQAKEILTKIGIEEIDCGRGAEFDPNFHEAVMHIEDDSLGEQEISQVFKKGYIYRGRVVRHAVVQVAN